MPQREHPIERRVEAIALGLAIDAEGAKEGRTEAAPEATMSPKGVVPTLVWRSESKLLAKAPLFVW